MPIPASAAPSHDHGRNFGVHGMLVVGAQRGDFDPSRGPVYMSHLPMFAAPHDFQVILEVQGTGAGAFGDFVAHFGPFEVYTFEPEPFALDELDPAKAQRRTSVTGNLYRGHFERGGEQIATDVTMEVERVVHYRQFAADPGEGTRDVMRYLCFGERQSAFVAHFITEPPDFDQIAVVTVDASGPSDDDLRAGVLMTVPDHPNAVASRLQVGDTLTALLDGRGGGSEASLAITVTHEVYLETGDLSG